MKSVIAKSRKRVIYHSTRNATEVISKLSKQFIFTLTLLGIPQPCSGAVDYSEIRTFVIGLDFSMKTKYLGTNSKSLSTILISILMIITKIIITEVIKKIYSTF